jgi:fructan beta-fructosidase
MLVRRKILFLLFFTNTVFHIPIPIIAQNDTLKYQDRYRLGFSEVFENQHYDHPLRPQVHFTPLTGQIADPTGLIWYKGKYHLFYMSDEWSRQRRLNKNWGHAVSNDCIFWDQLPPVTNTLIDNAPGSGSGIVDWNNTLGLERGTEKTLVVFYTDYGRGPSLAFSTDGGRTWVRHKNNPVLKAKPGLRDPLVFWYKPDQSWRMVIYEQPGFSFYRSKNLLNWEFLSKMNGFHECPDILHMPVDGNNDNKKWVLIDGNASYYIGDFDGNGFTPFSQKIPAGKLTELNRSADHVNYYTKDIYATQSWKMSYEGDGPFYQLAFMMIKDPPIHNRVWSQQLTFPVELTLKTINKEIRLCRNPIDAIKQLRSNGKIVKDIILKSNIDILNDVKGDVFEIILEVEPQDAKKLRLNIRGEILQYDFTKNEIRFLDSEEKINMDKRTVKLRVIIDRNSVEIFANEGETSISRLFYPEMDITNLGLTTDGQCKIVNLEVYPLKSIWFKREQELGYYR